MIRIGLLGASRVATYAMIEPVRSHPDCTVVAIAARDGARAEAYAQQHGIAEAFVGYQALIDHPGIDAVYNGLPPAMHRDWTIAALRAGKHVLCEKPFALNADEARNMFAAAQSSKRVLLEAIHSRMHPLLARARALVDEGAIGEIQHMDAVFTVPISDRPGELRYLPALGGGALMDLGIYPVHWLQFFMGMPTELLAREINRHSSGVDMETSARFAFGAGRTGALQCSMQTPLDNRLKITGSLGTLQITNPLAPQRGHRLQIRTSSRNDDLTVEAPSSYACQLSAFVAAIGGSSPLVSANDSIAAMQMMDMITRA
jgi:predicted dehydrogenase